ncbi:hypothetical protein MTR67_038919 [Solanum verrucosum]|uniref:Reverse transcriptase zinc-binding domain-containing protein n=1 Tax=Solanum verrucosum TaxID=315347 RepID=A0AAF0UGQ4_SOLVR|nr:hypothetical protein MTR67_038919 [Solanum verrucosum]
MMSLFPIHGKIIKKLDAIRRNFFWQGNGEGEKKYHLIKWEVVITNKKEGGLGIKNLKAQNKSLLLKWLWRLAADDRACGRTSSLQDMSFGRFLNDWEVERMIQFYNTLEQAKSLNFEEDRLLWKMDKDGTFKVKSAYKLLDIAIETKEGWPWKMIWKGKIPHKEACFTWLVAHQAVLTRDNLMKRGRQGIRWAMPRHTVEVLAYWKSDRTQGEMEDCPCMHMVDNLEGEKSEMF